MAKSLDVAGASHCVIPDGATRTREPSLRALAKVAGDGFDQWQRDINRVILAVDEDGSWAARTVVMSIPRQAGKTYDVAWVAIHRAATVPGIRIVWTAQHFSVIKDTFESITATVSRPGMDPLVDAEHGISLAAGKEEIKFRNGSRIFFRARERGALRGMKRIGLLVVDEAQYLSDSAKASMLPTQNRAENPQTIYMGTPPGPRDLGASFTRQRAKCLSGHAHSTFYVEFSADRDGDPMDRAQWAKANPSYPAHTDDESILTLLDELTEDDFRREALGIWDEGSAIQAAIDYAKWDEATITSRPDGGDPAFGLDMNPSRTRLSLGACMRYDDGTAHVEIAEYRDTDKDGVMWAVHRLAGVWDRSLAVVVDAQSPAIALLPELQNAGITVTVTNASDMGRACGRWQDMLRDGLLTHLPEDGQEPLWQAVRKATARPVGHGGQFAWNRPDDDLDISPLVSCTLALHGAMTSTRDPDTEQEVWY